MEKADDKIWFKAKLYGWGWYPCTWQGWAIILFFAIAEILLFKIINYSSHSASDTLINFVPFAFLLIIVLVIICYIKGERPRWRWGK